MKGNEKMNEELREQMQLNDDEERVKNLAAILWAEIKMNHEKNGGNNFCNDELVILRAMYFVRQMLMEEDNFDMLELIGELNRIVVMDLISSDKVEKIVVQKGRKNDEAGS